jgi:hypothetical protein
MAEQTFTIADYEITWPDKYRIDLDAPLPLSYVNGLKRAAQMRNAEPTVYSWRVISRIMVTYHGINRTPNWWRNELFKAGLVERSPRGNPFTTDDARLYHARAAAKRAAA